MDFAFNETQTAIRDLCKDILKKTVTVDSLKALEAKGEWMHQEAWEALAQAELLSLSVSEADGGAGLGLIELCLVLQQIGLTVAPLPFLDSIVMGAWPIAQFGSPAQKKSLLPGLLAGTSFMSCALVDGASQDVYAPATRATRRDDGWTLSGQKSCVPGIENATNILVPVRVDDQRAVFIVPREKLRIERQVATHGAVLGFFDLDALELGPEALLGTLAEGKNILAWIIARSIVANCAIKLGIAERALFMTAEYTSQRTQFGVPVATFQAVSQRAADAYIDVVSMRLTLWRAAWAVSEGHDVGQALAVAKYWSCEAGHRVAATAQHLHGGMGFDRDHPLHRYFLWSKFLEFSLGGASAHLEALGQLIANEASAP